MILILLGIILLISSAFAISIYVQGQTKKNLEEEIEFHMNIFKKRDCTGACSYEGKCSYKKSLKKITVI